MRIFKTRFHSTPSLRLGWTTKLDPALRPLLKIRYDILGNKNNVSGASNELVFLGVGLWSNKHKHCCAIRRSDRYSPPDRYVGISYQSESKLVHVELKTSFHIGNENGKGVNAEVGGQTLWWKRRPVRPLERRRTAHQLDYKAEAR